MNLLETLRGLGSKLKIIEVRPSEGPAPVDKVATRAITLAELRTEVQAEEVRALAQLPAELSVPFEKVYAAAGVQAPAHGWTVEKLVRTLREDPYKRMERDPVQRALRDFLGAQNIPVEDLVRDAITRDQALDAFEKFVHKKLDDRLAARDRRAVELEAKIVELQEAKLKLEQESAHDRELWKQWRARKRGAERDLAWAIGFLFDKPVVSVDEEPPEGGAGNR